jgi:D-sedoheptulose 7-phosphate isomerase
MKADKPLTEIMKQAEQASVIRRAMLENSGQLIVETANLISGVIGAGGKVLIAGNGGSASMASHFAAEMIVRLTSERNRESLPAIALTTDVAVITACGNDFGFDNIFSRQVDGIGCKGDMLLVMSTSGNSENLVRAVNSARARGMLVTALLGGEGGKLARMMERPLIVPHTSTQRIQEEHLFLVHTLVELVERGLFA